MKYLKINSNNGFLNLEDLPHNCIFNKVVTGCGGTTVVLKNKESYVIAVPTTELIVNKTGKSESGLSVDKNLFGLFGEFTYRLKKELKEYTSSEGIKKIMCTYDKLPKLAEYLDTSKYRLLIDEYHSLLKAYSYRNIAIDGVLKAFKDYKSYCFMSATPINAEFKPSALEGIEEITAMWDSTDTLVVSLQKTNKPLVKAANFINSYKLDGFIEINGIKSYEAFFFINSVRDIKKILEITDLSNDEVRIICADTEKNRKTLEGYSISNSNSANKQFTFITSKSFEGVDYFSETGMCFVVSTSNVNTLAGIDTDIPQIAGRIRTKDNPFKNIIIHIFNTQLNNLDLSYEEIEKKTLNMLEDAKKTAVIFNDLPDSAKLKMKNKANDLYVSYDNELKKFTVNDVLPKLELYNYKLNKVIYSSGLALRKEYLDKDILTTKIMWEQLEENKSVEKLGKKLPFKDAFYRYKELKDSFVITGETDILEKQFPLLIPAYHILGEDVLKRLRFVQKAIKEELMIRNDQKSLDNKVFRLIRDDIKIGEFIAAKEAKELLHSIYQKLDIKESAKGSNLEKWFEIKEMSKRIDNKIIKGYIIIRSKFIFK